VSISLGNIQRKIQSTKTLSLDFHIKPLDETQIDTKNISTINPLLSHLRSSKDIQIYEVKAQKVDNCYSF
tara:strand:+ start:131 stop:340 length:210 start_codon:yes stop_codon:yes gene_type:complete